MTSESQSGRCPIVMSTDNPDPDGRDNKESPQFQIIGENVEIHLHPPKPEKKGFFKRVWGIIKPLIPFL